MFIISVIEHATTRKIIEPRNIEPRNWEENWEESTVEEPRVEDSTEETPWVFVTYGNLAEALERLGRGAKEVAEVYTSQLDDGETVYSSEEFNTIQMVFVDYRIVSISQVPDVDFEIINKLYGRTVNIDSPTFFGMTEEEFLAM